MTTADLVLKAQEQSKRTAIWHELAALMRNETMHGLPKLETLKLFRKNLAGGRYTDVGFKSYFHDDRVALVQAMGWWSMAVSELREICEGSVDTAMGFLEEALPDWTIQRIMAWRGCPCVVSLWEIDDNNAHGGRCNGRVEVEFNGSVAMTILIAALDALILMEERA